ncbi:site-specific integrase [Dietzia sp. KRD202]|uniref:site-specific integrase n=1 Tax=Dietzia sp. KRD202 TaxID=2729732 RepID=UPI0019CFFD1A|nr:site-specific integrase [Dietzia sp. KRD202]
MQTRSRMAPGDVLAAFDEHLRRTRGLCAGTRRNYILHVGGFLETLAVDGGVDVAEIQQFEVAAFVSGLSSRYQLRTVELAATSLRVFFRFLRAVGLRADRLDDAVPMVPHRSSGLVRHLVPQVLEQLIASLKSGSPRDLRIGRSF